MTKAESIAEHVLTRVRKRVYVDKVPGERVLAKEFAVDFKTANRALSALVDRGVLVRRRGRGTFVAPRRKWRGTTIGLAFFKHTDPGVDPVFTRLFLGAATVGKDEGCLVDITTLHAIRTRNRQRRQSGRLNYEKDFADDVLAADPDGVIYMGNIHPPLIQRLLRDRPGIVVGQLPPDLEADNVRRDLGQAVEEAVQAFASRGHEHIAFITYDYRKPQFDLVEKAAGYARAMAALPGCPPQTVAIPFPPGPHLLDHILALKPKPTAVVAAESTLGISLLRHAPARGVVVPDDLAVISFDDGDIGEHTYPGMSSIHAFGEELGALAVRKLLDRLGGQTPERIDAVLPCELIERESSQWDLAQSRRQTGRDR